MSFAALLGNCGAAAAQSGFPDLLPIVAAAADQLAVPEHNCLWHRQKRATPGEFESLQDIVAVRPASARARQLYEHLYVTIHRQHATELASDQQAKAAERRFTLLTVKPDASAWARCDAILAVSAPVVTGRFAAVIAERATKEEDHSTQLPLVLERVEGRWRLIHSGERIRARYVTLQEGRVRPSPIQLDFD